MEGQATAPALRAGEAVAAEPVGFLYHFKNMPDPRAANHLHKLTDILAIAFCAVICGADDWVAVEVWAKSRLSWLKSFLDLPLGVPSHDTFGRVFAALDPDAFEACFGAWSKSLGQSGKLLAIDGKSIRRSFEHAWDKSGMSHLLSAFCCDAEGGGRVLCQCAVGEKNNEISAMPRLLEMLDLQGMLVTADALHCQRELASRVTQAKGDYLLAVKENQPLLHSKLQALMDEIALEQDPHDQQTDAGHGRIETRSTWVHQEAVDLGEELLGQWAGLSCLAMIECRRQVMGQNTISRERRYFISSLKQATAPQIAVAVRSHWKVENQLHWQLDVSFGEDQRRLRKGNSAENFSRLCRMALSRLKTDKTIKAGVKNKRLAAGWDPVYLLRLLTT